MIWEILRRNVLIICFVLVAMTLSAFTFNKSHIQKDYGRSSKALAQAPNFELKALSGKVVSLDAYKGKAVLINFWATWCGPCIAEVPGLIKLYKKYQEDGLVVIGVSVENDLNTIGTFVKNNRMNYPVLVSDKTMLKQFGGVRSIPTTFILNRNHQIVEKLLGYEDYDYFEQRIKKLL